MNIRKPTLAFGELSQRPVTDMLVIHHTGSVKDTDCSVEQIHAAHLNNGWAGCGYHFVIRKDGTVEIGRPEWAVGSHAYGENSHTVGIHLSGDFDAAYPSQNQIQACAELVRDLCKDYRVPCDRAHIVGHCDLMPTGCPGKNLYSQLQHIIDLAADKIAQNVQIKTMFDLAERFSSRTCADTERGYGLYKLNPSAVTAFVYWLKNYPDDKLANYGRVLDTSSDFAFTWHSIGVIDSGHFSDLQREFAKKIYFDETADLLSKEGFHVDKHSVQLQAVIFARTVQQGVFGCIELCKRACKYPNLSYIDDVQFDRAFIADLYDYLIANPSFIKVNSKLHDSLVNRFKREKTAALA